MKKVLSTSLKVIFVLLMVSWIGLITVEFIRYKNDEPMLIVIGEDELNYDDGKVYVYYGLGYKSIIYRRTSIDGKEFGHIFLKVREEIPS